MRLSWIGRPQSPLLCHHPSPKPRDPVPAARRAGWLGGLTGDGGIDGEGPEAGHLLPAGHLHPSAEDVLPGVQLEQLDATEHLVGLLQPLVRILLPGAPSQRWAASAPVPHQREELSQRPHHFTDNAQLLPSSLIPSHGPRNG